MANVYSWLFEAETFSSGFTRTLVQPEDVVWVLRDWSVVLLCDPGQTFTLDLALNGGSQVSVTTCAACAWQEHWSGRIVIPAYRAPDPPPVVVTLSVVGGGTGFGNYALSGYQLFTP